MRAFIFYSMNSFDEVGTAAAGVAIGLFIVIALIGLLIGLAIAILFLLNLQNVLKEVDSKNREVPDSNVWLMLIPLFNVVYGFILYPKICDSVKKEYAYRGFEASHSFQRELAIAMPILTLCSIIPFLGALAGIANLVIFIIFWVKMAEYKNYLKANPKKEELPHQAV